MFEFLDDKHKHLNGDDEDKNVKSNTKLDHYLDDKTIGLLINEIEQLYEAGFSWRNKYTQCVVNQIIYSQKLATEYHPGLCAKLLKDASPDIVCISNLIFSSFLVQFTYLFIFSFFHYTIL